MFCVLKLTKDVNPTNWSPTSALQKIKETLEGLYYGKVAEPQRRSVNIEFSGTGIAYDVVPAFVDEEAKSRDEEVFIIPDVDQSKWIRSNPRVHREKSVEANEKAGKEFKPLTKAVKHWNRRQPEAHQLRSFHIETMAWSVLTEKPENRVQHSRTVALVFLGIHPKRDGNCNMLRHSLSSGSSNISKNWRVANSRVMRDVLFAIPTRTNH